MVLASDFRCDLIVEGKVIVEIKSVERLVPVHEMQVLTYLKIADLRLGLLINFNDCSLRDGSRRVSHGAESLSPRPSAPSAAPR